MIKGRCQSATLTVLGWSEYLPRCRCLKAWVRTVALGIEWGANKASLHYIDLYNNSAPEILEIVELIRNHQISSEKGLLTWRLVHKIRNETNKRIKGNCSPIYMNKFSRRGPPIILMYIYTRDSRLLSVEGEPCQANTMPCGFLGWYKKCSDWMRVPLPSYFTKIPGTVSIVHWLFSMVLVVYRILRRVCSNNSEFKNRNFS